MIKVNYNRFTIICQEILITKIKYSMNQQLCYIRSGPSKTFVPDPLLNRPPLEFIKVVWEKVETVPTTDSTAPGDDK